VAREVLRDAAVERRAPPEDGDQLVEDQDQAESGEHLVEVVALVQRAQRDSSVTTPTASVPASPSTTAST
jgi:hypothetical protein